MSSVLASALEKLLSRPEGLPSSTLTPAQRKALEAWARNTGAVRVIPSGRGVAYQVRDIPVLEAHLSSLRPRSMDTLPEDIPKRAANIALTRNSKGRGHAHESYYLLLKAVGHGVGWRDGHGCELDLSRATGNFGVGALAIQPGDGWQSDSPLWLVENQALFDRLDWMPKGVTGSVAYYAGQLTGRVLDWLGAQRRTPEVVLFPDYDGVGLLNYLRLKEANLAPSRFWIMPRWRSLLRDYGSARVWQNTLPQFEAALQGLDGAEQEAELLELIYAMRQSGLALEHEAVWLANSAQN